MLQRNNYVKFRTVQKTIRDERANFLANILDTKTICKNEIQTVLLTSYIQGHCLLCSCVTCEADLTGNIGAVEFS